MKYYDIAVFAPLYQSLTYRSNKTLKEGQFVEIPLASKKTTGLVLSPSRPLEHQNSQFEIKEIIKVYEDIPYLDPVRLQWLRWMSQYYFYPIGLVASLFYPPSIPKRKSPEKDVEKLSPSKKIILNSEQKECVSQIQKSKDFQVHLIHGVTGSGKTEVYFELMDQVIKKNKKVLFLVPEISLTPQLFQRVSERFPDQTSLIHSGIQSNKRYQEWYGVVQGSRKILIGARSALFCPVSDLGLIILDEEHETHFKQEEKFKYHARNAAIMLANMYNIPIVLGSATPSLEVWHQAQKGIYHYYQIKKRFKNLPLPSVQVVQLKKDKEKKNSLPFWLSEELFESIKKTLNQKSQVALFLNRRGQSSLTLCSLCGSSLKCPHCDISLVLHFNHYLVCHYCNYSVSARKAQCCSGSEITHLGVGTESVSSEMKKLFPKARIQVVDSDHVQTPRQFTSFVQDMTHQKIDILVGTQMIAKGFNFPHLKLVGLILADLALHAQDFRAAERCFQLITQMSGRAGRFSSGQVIVQSYNPQHYAIQMGASYNFKGMADKELKYRKELGYPPFTRLVLVQVTSLKQDRALKVAQSLYEGLAPFTQMTKSLKCLGPAPAPIFKLRSRYRYHILLKSPSSQNLDKICKWILEFKTPLPSVRIQINKDPILF